MGQLYLITGDDEAAIAKEARQLVARLAGDPPDEFSLDICKESDDRPAAQVIGELIASVNTPPFLGGAKTVFLQNCAAFAEEPAAAAKDADLTPVAKALRQLAELLASGIPEDIHLVLSGPGADGRKALAKACATHGQVIVRKKPEMRNARWTEEVARLVRDGAEERGMTLTPPMVRHLVEVVGVDTGRLQHELEKIYCYGGEKPTLEQLQAVCVGSHEAGQFALTNALGDRNLSEVMTVLEQTLGNDKNADSTCIGLVRQISAFFRRLLQVKALMIYEEIKEPRQLEAHLNGMSDAAKAKYAGNEAFGMNPYYLKNLAAGAVRYDPRELLRILSWLAEFDRLSVSSSIPRRLALETLLTRIVAPPGSQRRPRPAPPGGRTR